MDVPAMHLEQHERGIHVVRPGTRGAGVTDVRSDACAAVHATNQLSGHWAMRLIQCTVDPQINHEARINRVNPAYQSDKRGK
jgi:hypothetical protein